MRQQHAEQTAEQPEREYLQQVNGDDPRSAGAEAFEDSDSLSLLFDEGTCDVPHADAAEHEDKQAGQRQIILGPGKVLAEVLLLLAIRVDLDRRARERIAKLFDERRRICGRSV